MIVIVDYKLDNLDSIETMRKKVGMKTISSSDIKVIADAEKLILSSENTSHHAMRLLEDIYCEVLHAS